MLKLNKNLKLYVDYQGLNAIIIKNQYPLPLINKMLDRLVGAWIFSKINLWNAYYWICIMKKDK